MFKLIFKKKGLVHIISKLFLNSMDFLELENFELKFI